jgi:predicted TIM-barrel fold metal-dependent hydrolase
MPAGACDCHVHVFGPRERYPLAADRVYTPGPATLEDLRALHRGLHFDRVVIVQASVYGTDNSCMVDALQSLGPHGRGVAVIGPSTSDAALDEMHRAGVRGVRLNLETYGKSDPAAALKELRWAAARVAPLGWHVQIYSSLAVVAALHDAILELPTLLVVDHFGRALGAHGVDQAGFAALLSLLRRGKINVKISGAYRLSQAPDYADMAPLARALIAANRDGLVWGTDWPHTGAVAGNVGVIEPFRPEDDGRALDRLAGWAPDPNLMRTILVDTPARLYGFDKAV